MYNKLFAKILDSSIWLEPDPVRIVWITLLAAMDQDGYAHFSAIQNLADRARVTLESARLAIEKLMAPDPESGIQENQGRRIERVPGGFIILNAQYYKGLVSREIQRENTRERVRRFRAKKNVTHGNDSVTPSETETDKKTETKNKRPLPPDFHLNEKRREYAVQKGVVSPESEFEAFRAHHQAHGKLMKDWDAAWRTWCLNCKKFGGVKGSGGDTPTYRLSDDELKRKAAELKIDTRGKTRDQLVATINDRSAQAQA